MCSGLASCRSMIFFEKRLSTLGPARGPAFFRTCLQLETDLTQIDACSELRLDRRLRAARGCDLDRVAAGVLLELVELEVPVIVAHRLGHDAAVLDEPHARALDAVDRAIRLGRQRAADEALR